MTFIDTLLIVPHKIIPFIAGLAGVGFVIAFHEFGHFIFCKIFNIKTPSFSIGFGPRLLTKKIGETEFAISAIPLGGYVEIAGAAEVGQGEQVDAKNTDERSFVAKPWIQKFLVMSGGIVFNIILAYVTFSLLYMTGMPKSMILYPKNATATVSAILPGSPAEIAGIQPGDMILEIDQTSLKKPFGPALVKKIFASPDQPLTLLINRNGTTQEIQLTTKSQNFLGETIGSAGIYFETTAMPSYSFIESIKKGIRLTHEHMYNTVKLLRHAFSKKDSSMVAGPIRIIAETFNGAQQGLSTLLLFLAIISISLAMINLLPLPILDGGQIVFYTIEAIIGRSIPDKVREYIHIACWILFLIFFLYLSYKDIARLIHPYTETILNLLGLKK